MKRLSFLTLAFLVVAGASAAAEPAPTAPKRRRPLTLGPVEVEGRRQLPVGVVIPRDASVKEAIDRLDERHLEETTRR